MTIRFTPRLILCTALGLAAAGPLGTQAQDRPSKPGSVRDAIGGKTKTSTPPPTASNAPPPAQVPAATSTPAAQASTPGATLDERQKQILGTLHTRHMNLVDAGQIAAQKGTTPEVRQLGQRVDAEARSVDEQLKQLVASRGGNVDQLPVVKEERDESWKQLEELKKLSGLEFDRQFVLALRANEGRYVNDLKRMRDETPGKDAQLKGWLDHAENVAEWQLDASRQAKQKLDAQRAAQK